MKIAVGAEITFVVSGGGGASTANFFAVSTTGALTFASVLLSEV